jgi:uncharacterized heparinase superfamily protein
MAIGPNTGQKLIGELLGLLATLPPAGIDLVLQLIRAIRTSKDPLRAVRLAAMAAASKHATESAIEAALKKLK